MWKVCNGCAKLLPAKNFHKYSKAKDGLQYKCKKCQSAEHAENYWKNRERRKETAQQYAQRPEVKEKIRNRNRNTLGRRRRVWYKVARAVKRGELVKPGHCQQCNRRTRVEAHHGDYRKWREVRWLCRKCHANV